MKPDLSSLRSCSLGPRSSASVAPMFMQWFMNLAYNLFGLLVVDHLVIAVLASINRPVNKVPPLQPAEPLQLVLHSPEERRPSTRRSPLHRKGDMCIARGHEGHLNTAGGTTTCRAWRSVRTREGGDFLRKYWPQVEHTIRSIVTVNRMATLPRCRAASADDLARRSSAAPAPRRWLICVTGRGVHEDHGDSPRR